jgi:hypothetical protein
LLAVEHEKGELPRIEIKDNKYFCEGGKTKVKIEDDEIVISCRIKF